MSELRPAARTSSFTESVIREMTRLAMEHDAVNLAQGFPDFPSAGSTSCQAGASTPYRIAPEVPIRRTP